MGAEKRHPEFKGGDYFLGHLSALFIRNFLSPVILRLHLFLNSAIHKDDWPQIFRNPFSVMVGAAIVFYT